MQSSSKRTGDVALRRLASVDNFRDVAGPGEGYRAGAARMRRGVFYRSNRLEASPSDQRFLAGLGLTAIHDLRESDEIDRHRDVSIDGATWLNHPVPGLPKDVVKALRTADDSRRAMVEKYRAYVSDATHRAGFASALSQLIDDPGPQLFHCAAGKDRTGWTAALLQSVAGADRATIHADYALTDEYGIVSRQSTLDAILEHLGKQSLPIFEPAFRCLPEYLDAALDEVERAFGGVDGYLRDGLGLTADRIDHLRARLVV